MEFHETLKSRWATGILLGVLGLVGFVTVELYMQKRHVDAEVSRLKSQSEELARGNSELSELIKHMDTPEYKEREAREKLNLKREGEQVVVLPSADELAALQPQQPTQKTNPQAWLAHFFE